MAYIEKWLAHIDSKFSMVSETKKKEIYIYTNIACYCRRNIGYPWEDYFKDTKARMDSLEFVYKSQETNMIYIEKWLEHIDSKFVMVSKRSRSK